MDTEKPLLKDSDGDDVDVHLYKSMIGSLMYLTSSKSHLSDYTGASLDRKSTTRGCQFLGCKLISWQCKKQKLWLPLLLLKLNMWLLLVAVDKYSGFKIKCWIMDGTVKTVTKASARRHLQLADADGISSLPTTKIFEQLSLMGDQLFRPISPTQTPVADKATSTCVDVRYGGATTTVIGLEAGQGSGNIDKTPTLPHDSPLPRVNTLGSDEGSMILQELMVFCKTLSKKVESLETNLKQAKKIYGAAYTRLIKKVKNLEKTSKSSQARRKARIVVSDDEDDLEDPSKQGRKIATINQDPGISLEVSTAEKDVSTAKPISTAGVAVTTTSVIVSTVNPTRNTGASNDDDITMAETMVYLIWKSLAKDKGTSKIDESEEVQTLIKLQLQQERLGLEEAMRLQAKFEEEERKRIARVQEAASSLNIEEWDDIKARFEADVELVQRLQAEEKAMYTKAEQARMLAKLMNQRKKFFAAKRAEEMRNKPPTQA
ncbi:hypothetical protein Tco_0914103 [Tanacetum coccineum]